MTLYESFEDFILVFVQLRDCKLTQYCLGNQILENGELNTSVVTYTNCGTIYHQSKVSDPEKIQVYQSLFEAGSFQTNHPFVINKEPDITVKSSNDNPFTLQDLLTVIEKGLPKSQVTLVTRRLI